jgi:hypothetical protein
LAAMIFERVGSVIIISPVLFQLLTDPLDQIQYSSGTPSRANRNVI